MNVSLRLERDTLILTMYGVFGHKSSLKVQRLVKNFNPPYYLHLIFDLQHVKMIDSAGLGTIFLIAHDLRGRGGHTRIVGPSLEVRSLLERVDIPSLAPIFSDEGEALRVA